MAYILGFLFADGSLEDASYLRGKYLRVSNINKDSVSYIKKSLEAEHPILELPPRKEKHKPRYFLRIGSHKMYDSLVKLQMHPNKSLTALFPDVPKKYLGDFIRGYFDGDGCVHLSLSEGKKQKTIVRKLQVIFTSGSQKFLKVLSERLSNFCGEIKISNSHRSFQLRYNTRQSINIFRLMYQNAPKGFCFKDKLTVFIKYFKLRPVSADKMVKNILLKFGHVVK